MPAKIFVNPRFIPRPRQTPSKSLQLWKRQLAALHMHATQLGAAMQGGHGFAGIEQAVRVEGGFEGMELAEFGRIKLLAHLP